MQHIFTSSLASNDLNVYVFKTINKLINILLVINKLKKFKLKSRVLVIYLFVNNIIYNL